MKLLVLTVSLAAIAFPVHATDFSVPITDEFDKPAIECIDPQTSPPTPAASPVCKTQLVVTLGILAARALNQPDDEGKSPENIVHRGMLARKLSKGGEQQLDAADIVLLRRMFAKFPPIIAAQGVELIGGNPPK